MIKAKNFIDNCKFTYRLGYACINTRLRKTGIFSSRTARLETVKTKGFDWIKNLALQNLQDLLTISRWNVENGFLFMRMSSEMFPFSTHIEYKDIWQETLKEETFLQILQEIGTFAKSNRLRLTFHPGQYSLLSSKNDNITQKSVLDIDFHSQIMDLMGLDKDGVIIIHGGGVYGDKTKSLQRIVEAFSLLSQSSKSRIVFENCELAYSIEDLLPLCEQLDVPLVIDFHHHAINKGTVPLEQNLERICNIWKRRGMTQKIHVSNSAIPEARTKKDLRKHSDYIDYFHKEILLLENYVDHIDIMLEAKMKEDAIISLFCTQCRI